MVSRIYGRNQTTHVLGRDGGCSCRADTEARRGGRHPGGGRGLVVLHRTASAVQPWRQRRLDRQFD